MFIKASNVHRVLGGFAPFLRVFQAFNSDNFEKVRNPQGMLRSIVYACCAAGIIINWTIFFIMLTWNILENGFGMKKFVLAGPLIATISQMCLTFIAMMRRNRTISQAIDQLQEVIDERK